MCVNPFTEELIFRGLLVHQFARVGAPLWLAVLVGALVNVANHWYQGRALVRSHLAFYAWSVVLLYSPVGMLGAMGFHFLADIWPSLYQRQMLEEYRAQRRARLASANKPAKPAA
jgi:membrane protease YdiL (CAAX protease family)